MAKTVNEAAPSATPGARAMRAARLIRAAVLLAAGAAIAFTATLHDDIGFDVSVVFGALSSIGIATAIEYWVLRGTAESWWIAARAIIAFAAAGSMLAVNDSPSMAVVLAIWAALTAVITAMRLVRGVQPRRVALPSLLLSLALVIAVLLVQGDPVAVIGFFGAYALIRGVFLGISAFDPRAETSTTEQAATTSDD